MLLADLSRKLRQRKEKATNTGRWSCPPGCGATGQRGFFLLVNHISNRLCAILKLYVCWRRYFGFSDYLSYSCEGEPSELERKAPSLGGRDLLTLDAWSISAAAAHLT